MSNNGVAHVVFMARENSCAFDERCVPLMAGAEPVEIGRSSRRLPTPACNTAMFECTVMSRVHALIWYKDDKVTATTGWSTRACLQFFIKDNQSANGTFVNERRLPSYYQAPPQQIFSGDEIQFGDCVTGIKCVVATVKLWHPDKREATQDRSTIMNVLRSVSTGGGQREVPDYLTCGITFALMRDPVITPAGYTYDRSAIMQYLDAGGSTDPNTRTPLSADQLVPNRAVKLAIEHFITGNHWATVDGM